MTTFKDPNGDEWRVIAERECDDMLAEQRDATVADLLSALGQLSTGSDGPTDLELRDIESAVTNRRPRSHADSQMMIIQGRRALFAAGLALGEQKLKAQGWRHVPDTHEVIPKGRHEWVLKSDHDAAESELAATKAKLAETEAESEKYRLGMRENCQLRAKLAEVEREREWFRKERSQRVTELLDLSEERNQLRSELASARRVVEAATEALTDYVELIGMWEREANGYATHSRVLSSKLKQALASAGTDADRTEPHRPEAGESGHDPHYDPECASCGHVASDHRPGSCGACCEDECGDSVKCDCRRFREEEPKPEPRCTYWRPGWERRCGLATDGADLCPAHLMLSTRKFGLNVRPEETDVGIPRRDRIDQMTPAELAIRAAVEAVERVGAHPLLTDAVNLLHEAQGRVADYVDTTAEPKPEPQPSEEGKP